MKLINLFSGLKFPDLLENQPIKDPTSPKLTFNQDKYTMSKLQLKGNGNLKDRILRWVPSFEAEEEEDEDNNEVETPLVEGLEALQENPPDGWPRLV